MDLEERIRQQFDHLNYQLLKRRPNFFKALLSIFSGFAPESSLILFVWDQTLRRFEIRETLKVASGNSSPIQWIKPKLLPHDTLPKRYQNDMLNIVEIPIVDRKEQVTAIIMFRIDRDETDIELILPENHVQLLSDLSNRSSKLKLLIDTYKDLKRSLKEAMSIEEEATAILHSLVRLIKPSRGQLALINNEKKHLEFNCIWPEVDPDFRKRSRAVPDDSLTMATWNRHGQIFSISPDVEKEQNYYEVSPETKSAITVRWEVEGFRLGVVNLESAHFDPNVSKNTPLMAAVHQ